MTSWILVPCLRYLRAEFDEIAPDRDRSSDGSVGDLAHQNSQSDHNPDETGNVPIRDADRSNEVHALDVDVDLRVPGLSMEKVVQFLLARCRSGAENRLRYIIFNRRIWQAKHNWVQQTYTGANAHDHHAHFSASYDTAREASISSWHLEELAMPLSSTDAVTVWKADTIPNPKQRSDSKTNPTTTANFAVGDMWRLQYENAAAIASLRAQVAALAGKDVVDEPAIVAGVLAGLDPKAIAAAVTAAIPADQAKRVADELHARLSS